MNKPGLWILIVLGILSMHRSQGQDAPDPGRVDVFDPPQGSLLGNFIDAPATIAEGCGCYLRRTSSPQRRALVFFGKLGDAKESGWIAFKGRITEVPKEKADVQRTENRKHVRIKYYRSAAVAIQAKLVLQEEKYEDATYTGELTVVAGGRTEKIPVTGSCSC